MDHTGFSIHKNEKRKQNRRKQMIAYAIVFVCVFAAVGMVGTLSSGNVDTPTAADPNVQVNELLFTEGFNDDANGWIMDVDTEAYYENGEIHLVCRTPDGSKLMWSDQPNGFSNVAFQVKATKLSGPNQQYGLIFGQPDGAFNLFGVTENGYYGLMKWTGEEWSTVVNYTPSKHINEGGSNILTIICKNAENGYSRRYIELHVNGEYLQTLIMDSNPDEKVGLYVGAEDMHVSFDDFKVYSVD